LGPGQQVRYSYKEHGHRHVTTGTVVQKKIDTLIVSVGAIHRKIHYMDLII
jgi:hypothetical protein